MPFPYLVPSPPWAKRQAKRRLRNQKLLKNPLSRIVDKRPLGPLPCSTPILFTFINSINSIRSDYGSVQNRLESSLNNLHVYTENLAGAESRIRDADFAFETAQMSKYQTMQQAGVAILGQANQLSQGALRLIQ